MKNLPSVFDPEARPWIKPDTSDNQAIIKTVSKCPSGALSYKIADEHIREFNHEVKIRIDKNGPYQVRGAVNLNVGKDIEPVAKDHFALCRCGASRNKPYCDGSHSKSGFVDDKN